MTSRGHDEREPESLALQKRREDVGGSGLARYDDALSRAGQAADKYVQATIFDDYHQKKARGTKETQMRDLALFSRFLAQIGIDRAVSDLYGDPAAWVGMTASLLVSFRKWLLYMQPHKAGEEKAKGYRIGSVRRRMSTVKQYCRLASLSGAIPGEEWARIEAVKADSRAEGANVDADRERLGIVPSITDRKERATTVSWEEFTTLMHTTTGIKPYREHDETLSERDALLVCLLGEHGLRVGEVVALNVASINLRTNQIVIKRPKTHDDDVLPLLEATTEAARFYLPLLGEGGNRPLFEGYQGKRITRQGIYERLRDLGRLVGIPNLSPHDLRHFFAKNAFERGNPLNRLQRYGGWKSVHVPLRYAQQYGTDAGVLIVGTERADTDTNGNKRE
jgi:integrase